jgi:hypothetical protein
MPEPIMEPTTIAVELKRPREGTSCGLEDVAAGLVWDSVVTWNVFTGIPRSCLLISLARQDTEGLLT